MTDYVDIDGLGHYDGLIKDYIGDQTAPLEAAVDKLGFSANVATLPSNGTTSWDFGGGVYLVVLQNINKASLMGAYLIFALSGTGNALVIEPLHAATAATLTSSGLTLTIKTTTSGGVAFVVWPLTAYSTKPTAHQ